MKAPQPPHTVSLTESDSIEVEAVGDSAQNVELYQLEPAASNISLSSFGSDMEVENII